MDPEEGWRGITFVSRDVRVERQGDTELTELLVSAPMPGVINWNRAMHFTATVSLVSTPNSSSHQDGARLIKRREIEGTLLRVILRNTSLHVHVNGDKPIGAWIPGLRSSVAISSKKGFPSGDAASVIVEHYNNKDGKFPGTLDYPILDILGNDIYLAADADSAEILTGSPDGPEPNQESDARRATEDSDVLRDNGQVASGHLKKDEFLNFGASPRKDSQNQLVIVLHVPFSSRIGFIPLSSPALSRWHKERNPSGVMFIDRDQGSTRMTIENSMRQASEYPRIVEDLRKSDVVHIVADVDVKNAHDLTSHSTSDDLLYAGGGTGERVRLKGLSMRFPPLPPSVGFNVFGAISRLRLMGTMGDFMLGAKSFSVKAPSDIELRDIEALDLSDEPALPIPIQIDRADWSARLMFKATAQLFVNDDPVVVAFSGNSQKSFIVLLICTVLFMQGAALSGWFGIRSRATVGNIASRSVPIRKAKKSRALHEQAPRDDRFSYPLLRARAMIAGMVTALAAYVTFFGFYQPRFAVEPFVQAEMQDPYSQVFKISNQGNLDLHKVAYGCSLKGGWLDGTKYPTRIVLDENRWLEMYPFVKGETYRTLTPSETDSLNCKWFSKPMQFMLEDKRQIAIIVSYRPSYFPFRLEKRFGFSLTKSDDGSYHWLPIANERE